MCVQSIRKDTASTELVSLYYFDRDSVCSDSQMDKKALEKKKCHRMKWPCYSTYWTKSKHCTISLLIICPMNCSMFNC